MKPNDKVFIDDLSLDSGFPANKISAMLLNLEFKGVVEVLPGNLYRLR